MHAIKFGSTLDSSVQVDVIKKFDLPYEVVGEDTKSRLRIMPSNS